MSVHMAPPPTAAVGKTVSLFLPCKCIQKNRYTDSLVSDLPREYCMWMEKKKYIGWKLTKLAFRIRLLSQEQSNQAFRRIDADVWGKGDGGRFPWSQWKMNLDWRKITIVRFLSVRSNRAITQNGAWSGKKYAIIVILPEKTLLLANWPILPDCFIVIEWFHPNTWAGNVAHAARIEDLPWVGLDLSLGSPVGSLWPLDRRVPICCCCRWTGYCTSHCLIYPFNLFESTLTVSWKWCEKP